MEPVLDGIYYFEKQGNQIKPILSALFSNEELFRIEVSVQIMKRLFGNLNRSIAAGETYDEFVEEARRLNSEDPFALGTVDRRFRAFIYEWKMYTEHWKNYIKELNNSVYSDTFVDGFDGLFKETMDQAFSDPNFVTPHVIRNYISHANDAIHSSYVDGKDNRFYIKRGTLLQFLADSITQAGGKRKTQIEKQKTIIAAQEEQIDLVGVATKAMESLRSIEKALMDYQVEPQTIQACNILLKAKERIEEAGLSDRVWEIWRPTPTVVLDHATTQSITLATTIEGKRIEQTYYRERLNWIGYEAFASYISSFVNTE